MRLHIGERTTEQALCPVDGEPFGDVDELATAIVAAPRIAFRVLVGQYRALRLKYRARHNIFARNQLDLRLLANMLVIDRRRQLRIGGSKIVGKETRAAFGRPRG